MVGRIPALFKSNTMRNKIFWICFLLVISISRGAQFSNNCDNPKFSKICEQIIHNPDSMTIVAVSENSSILRSNDIVFLTDTIVPFIKQYFTTGFADKICWVNPQNGYSYFDYYAKSYNQSISGDGKRVFLRFTFQNIHTIWTLSTISRHISGETMEGNPNGDCGLPDALELSEQIMKNPDSLVYISYNEKISKVSPYQKSKWHEDIIPYIKLHFSKGYLQRQCEISVSNGFLSYRYYGEYYDSPIKNQKQRQAYINIGFVKVMGKWKFFNITRYKKVDVVEDESVPDE